MKKSRKKVIIGLVLAVLLIAVLVGLFLNHRHKQHLVTIPATSAVPKAAAKSTAQSSPQQSAAQTTTGSPATGKASSGTSATSNEPLTLSGAQTFVSNHKPGQNGTPTTEQSVCNTTPGATCYIQFTMGSLVKNLATKTADSNGVVVWNWDVKDAGFSSGSWQISAIASLNGQTKTVSDSASLEIQ